MNILKKALIVILFSSATAMAAPASDSSIKELLAITQSQKLVEGMRRQFDSLMNNAIQQAVRGNTPTAKQQHAISTMKNRMVALLDGTLVWEKLEPMYMRLYKQSFTEEEIAGMLSFYKTPAGQAVISKMPGLMQNTLLEVQKMVSGLNPQMQKIQQDFVTEMAAAGK